MKQLMQTLTVFLAAAGMIMTPVLLQADDMNDNASQNLAQAQSLARTVRRYAGTLQTFLRTPDLFTGTIHKRKLAVIKENTNDLGDIIQKLHNSRGELKQWQVQLVDRVLPRMDALTTDIGNAIRFIDEKPEADFTPTYEDYIDGIYNQSDSIVTTVDRYLDWANARQAKMELQAAAK